MYFNRSQSELVAGKWVLLVKDVSEVDPYDRLLRYVFVNNVFVNYELARSGFAEAKAYNPDVACQRVFQEAENLARKFGDGLWEAIPTAEPTQKPLPTEKLAPTEKPAPTKDDRGNCHPSYPTVCLAINAGDYDCAGGSGNGPNYVRGPIKVLPPDPFKLDGDGDGVGCE